MKATLSGVKNLALLVFADFRSKHWSQIFFVVCKFLAVALGDLCKDIATNNSKELLVDKDSSASSPSKIFNTERAPSAVGPQHFAQFSSSSRSF
jgi:hypothetical protein